MIISKLKQLFKAIVSSTVNLNIHSSSFKNQKLLAEQGDAEAQLNLGDMYSDGEGIAKDDREAVKWYRLAAEQGNKIAQYSI